MAKGQAEKQQIQAMILEAFPGSFLYNGNKEIRIPMNDVQIKITLTAAKDNVFPDDEQKVPGEIKPKTESISNVELPWGTESKIVEPNEDEINAVKTLMEELNI